MKEIKVLTVTSFGDKDGQAYRVTLNALNVDMVMADEALVQKQGMNLYKVNVRFSEDGGAELYITRDDLELLERAIGFYAYDDEI